MKDIAMHTPEQIESAEMNSLNPSSKSNGHTGDAHAKTSPSRTRFGIADLWKIHRKQRSAVAQRRNIL
ncbi:MAG: hypothetical protein ACK5B4_06430 [Bacteroidota bacterium]|jgi:hypothetical protein